MPDDSSKDLTFYPAFYFTASTTYNSWVKLTAAAVHRLQSRRGFEGQNVYFYNNHPIAFVVVAGIVVDFEPNHAYWLFHIDDGSGALVEVVLPRLKEQHPVFAGPGQAVLPLPSRTLSISEQGNQVDVAGIEIGKCIKVRGLIREFRGTKQVSLEKFAFLEDTTQEFLAWEAAASQFLDTLSKPWVLSRKQRAEIRAKARHRSRAGGDERSYEVQP